MSGEQVVVVLVEGESDVAALEVLLRRRGLASGVVLRDMGGVTNVRVRLREAVERPLDPARARPVRRARVGLRRPGPRGAGRAGHDPGGDGRPSGSTPATRTSRASSSAPSAPSGRGTCSAGSTSVRRSSCSAGSRPGAAGRRPSSCAASPARCRAARRWWPGRWPRPSPRSSCPPRCGGCSTRSRIAMGQGGGPGARPVRALTSVRRGGRGGPAPGAAARRGRGPSRPGCRGRGPGRASAR